MSTVMRTAIRAAAPMGEANIDLSCRPLNALLDVRVSAVGR
jgi:hypothetical protein